MFDSPFVLSLFVMGFIFGLISIIFSIEISGKVVACVCLTLIIIILPIRSFLFLGPLFHLYYHVIKVSEVGERIKVRTLSLSLFVIGANRWLAWSNKVVLVDLEVLTILCNIG